MMKNKCYAVFLMILGLTVVGCSADETQSTQQPVPSQTIEDPLARGRILFEDNCSICHGSDGTAGIANAANLHTSKLDSALVIQTITDGRKTMPAFKSQLSKEEIEKLALYVNSLRK